jgi:hypothetical protein
MINIYGLFSFFIYYLVKYWKLLLMLIVILCYILLIIIFSISYYIVKILKIKFNNCFFGLDNYTKESINVLEKYGNYNIKNVYLVKQPFSQFKKLIFNILTYNKYDKMLNEKSIFHTLIIVELKIKKNIVKKICIEKTNNLKILSNFQIYDNYTLKKIKIKKKIKLNELLNKTKDRIGSLKFFNFKLFECNCQHIVLEFLKTLCKNKKSKFIFQKLNKLENTQYGNYLLNGIINTANVVETFFDISYISNF